MHGKTKIELYNPNTNIKQVYREENTFQSSVLADYMRSLGEADNNPFANSSFRNTKPWINLVGGIFLFKDAIDLTGGVVKYMPAGNRMIGNGAYQIANGSSADDPTEMGSWNDAESSESASAITQVYDFATNQANGTIGCVCLTSQTGGYIGYGNTSGKIKTPRSLIANQSAYSVDASNTHSGNENAVIKGNFRYFFSVLNGIVTLTKTVVGISQGSVFQGMSTTKSFDLSEVGNHLGIVSDGFYPTLDGTEMYLIPMKAQSVNAGSTGYLYKFDTSDDTMQEISFTNSASVGISLSSSEQLRKKCGISNGYIFCCNGNRKISVIKLSNSEYIGELEIGVDPGAWQNLGLGLRLLDGFTLNFGDNGVFYIYDHISESLRTINGSISFERQMFQDKSNDAIQLQQSSGGVLLYKNPLYLATVNNLQSPVTKTAAQTMKVTYTLTEE